MIQPPINPPFIFAPSMVAFSQGKAMEQQQIGTKPQINVQLITPKQMFYIGLKQVKRINVSISTGPVFCRLRINRYNCHLLGVSSLCSLPQKDVWEMIVVQFWCKSMAERVCPPPNLSLDLKAAKSALCFSATERPGRWEMIIWG